MAYVEWHDTIRNHYKIDSLMLILNIKRREAVGIIGMLSSWAIQYRPGGIIERNLIRVAVEWEGDSNKLLNALIEAGWLDERGTEKVSIHDWIDITTGYRKARKDAKRRAEKKEESDGRATNAPQPRLVLGSAENALQTRDSSAAIAPLQPRTERAERSDPNGTTREEGGAASAVAPPASLSDVTREVTDFFGKEKTAACAATPSSGGVEEEILRRLVQLARQSKIAGKLDTIRTYIDSWIARSDAGKVEQILMDKWTKGKSVIEIQDYFFPKDKVDNNFVERRDANGPRKV